MILLAAMLDAPIIACLKRWPDCLHAIEMGAVRDGWKRGTFASACGLSGLRLVGATAENADGEKVRIAAPWPPRLAGLAPMVRCRVCWEATGRMRPRTNWVTKET